MTTLKLVCTSCDYQKSFSDDDFDLEDVGMECPKCYVHPEVKNDRRTEWPSNLPMFRYIAWARKIAKRQEKEMKDD
jgi:hypothetical protein